MAAPERALIMHGAFEAHEIAKALVSLVAGRATLQVLADSRQAAVGVFAGELQGEDPPAGDRR
jgi:hypothetical protein